MVIPCLCSFTVLLLAQTSDKQKRTQPLFRKESGWVRTVWWSIVSSSRTFRQAYRCCGQSASNRETEALRNASALARVLFQLIFVQGNAVQQITLILGSCIVINAEPFADCAELVKHFNSSRDIRLTSISMGAPPFRKDTY